MTSSSSILSTPALVPLTDLGVLAIRGADATRFLQGQLSNDVTRLTPTQAQLSGLHNPQGRTIALLRLLQRAPGELLAVLPRELAASVATRLGKYVLRSKVSITEESASWQVHGLVVPEGRDLPQGLPAQIHGTGTMPDGTMAVRVGDGRWLLISSGAPAVQATAAPRELWRRLDIEAGLPQVYAATSEGFVAQMLNLDALAGIAFDKGCYTGQEVIARAHYRGRVKRRMQRFVSKEAVQLVPGDQRQMAGGATLQVIEAVSLPDGRCEFLAVAPLESGEPEEAGTSATLEVERLALPYALP